MSLAECAASVTMTQEMSQNKTKCLDFPATPHMMTDLISCNTSSFFIILYALAPKLFALESEMIILIFLDILL